LVGCSASYLSAQSLYLAHADRYVQRGRSSIAIHWHELATYLAAVGWESLNRAKKRLKQPIAELIDRKYIAPESDWSGDYFVFHIGEKFLDELRNRLNAKQQYKLWISSSQPVKQLTILQGSKPSPYQRPSNDADEREVVLTRQAIKLALLNQMPDFELLSRFGWSKEDVESLAMQIKDPRCDAKCVSPRPKVRQSTAGRVVKGVILAGFPALVKRLRDLRE
jgi:hypothetical protein